MVIEQCCSVMEFAGRGTRAVHHGVGPGFEADEEKGEDGHGDLKALGTLFFGAAHAAAPLRGGLIAEVVNPSEDGEIGDRADGGDPEHRDANSVLVPAVGGRVNAGGSGQCGESDGNADAADGEDRGAETLGQGDDKGSGTQGTPFSGIQRAILLVIFDDCLGAQDSRYRSAARKGIQTGNPFDARAG